jgi:hypothetical protein
MGAVPYSNATLRITQHPAAAGPTGYSTGASHPVLARIRTIFAIASQLAELPAMHDPRDAVGAQEA